MSAESSVHCFLLYLGFKTELGHGRWNGFDGVPTFAPICQ